MRICIAGGRKTARADRGNFMKICIAGGKNEADFLVGMFLKKRNKLLVINESEEFAEKLSAKYGIAVYAGDPCKSFVLDDAGVKNFDIIIALKDSDADNLQIGQTAKKQFNVKKAVCVVSNPKNVEIFKKLGINVAISSAFTIAEMIEKAATFEDIVKTMTIDEKIVLTEIEVEEDFSVVGQQIMDIKFPEDVIISCILRDDDMIVPRGQTKIEAGDKLMFMSAPNDQKKIINMFTKEAK